VRLFKWMLGFTALCATATPLILCAEDAQIPPAYLADGTQSPIAVYVAAAKAEDESSAIIGQGVDNATLDGMSGGTMVTQNTTLTGTVSNDSADQVNGGANVLTGGSFGGAAGIPVVVQNSGSNVLIQNAVVINVQFKP
jgi:hypothetical protein